MRRAQCCRQGYQREMPEHACGASASLLLLPAVVHASEPVTLSGHVIAVNNGQGVAQSAVTLTFATVSGGPTAITVFSDEQGAFRMPLHVSAIPADTSLEAHKLGYRQVSPAGGAVQVKSVAPSGSFETRLYLDPVADIAQQVPASAWLAQAPPGDAKNITLTSCSSCHQVPSPKMREYAAKIEAVRGGPDGDRKAIEEWRKVVRHESWRTIVKYMRSHHYSVFPLESAMNLDAVDWPTAQNARLQLLQRSAGRDRRELPGRALSALDCLPAERCVRLRRAARREPENRDPRVRISGRRAGARARAGARLAVSLGRGCAAQSDRASGPARRCDPVDRGRLQGLDRSAHDRARRRGQPVGHDGRQRSVRSLRPANRALAAVDAAAVELARHRSRWPAQRSCTTCPSTRAGTWRATHRETSG